MEKDKFISVIRDNQKLIFKICHSYCPDSEDRKDLQQEILIRLWNSFSKFDGRVKISTWIYRIALNTAISFYRTDSKHRQKIIGLDDSVISLAVIEPYSELDENITLLYKFIECMNELDKALILLYLDNNKYRDIAEILGISESNTATRISRIKLYLKEKFNNN